MVLEDSCEKSQLPVAARPSCSAAEPIEIPAGVSSVAQWAETKQTECANAVALHHAMLETGWYRLHGLPCSAGGIDVGCVCVQTTILYRLADP